MAADGAPAGVGTAAEQIVFEVPYVIDQLTVNLLAHNEDLITALQAMMKRPEGGYLVREFLQVVTDNARSGQIGRALKRMAERNSDLPVVVRIAELLTPLTKWLDGADGRAARDW